tara:strand:+ start:1066 stop:1365 length:300 start_codon:yes stop_codon:yes gene_type:complete
MKPKKIDAIIAIDPNAKVVVRNKTEVEWLDSNPNNISEDAIKNKWDELIVEYDALAWKRSREAEYPSVQELVVALYDTDDKSAIEAKRAAVKLKYPKPE